MACSTSITAPSSACSIRAPGLDGRLHHHGKIKETLVDLDAKGQPVGVLAERWEASPDGKTVTFKLRKGVTWHDGKPFTSADVQFTAMEMWKKILNYGTTLQQFLDAVETPDRADRDLPSTRGRCRSTCCCAPCPTSATSRHALYEGGDIRENPANLAPIGTGPFKFVQYERGQFIIADRNANYWRPNAPYLDRIVWRVITDRAAAAAQWKPASCTTCLSRPDDLRYGAARQGQALHRLDQGQ